MGRSFRKGVAVSKQGEIEQADNPILIYDGHCGLCHRAVRYVMDRDRHKRFRFAANTSNVGKRILAELGLDAEHPPETMVVVVGRRYATHSDAALEIARQLGGVHRLAAAGRLMPRVLRDMIYKCIAANRYRLFGRYDECRLPTAADRSRFLDVDESGA